MLLQTQKELQIKPKKEEVLIRRAAREKQVRWKNARVEYNISQNKYTEIVHKVHMVQHPDELTLLCSSEI